MRTRFAERSHDVSKVFPPKPRNGLVVSFIADSAVTVVASRPVTELHVATVGLVAPPAVVKILELCKAVSAEVGATLEGGDGVIAITF